jgi:O-antigen/teichoic acid export membrane protein
MGRVAQGHRESAWRDAAQDLKMKPVTRTRLLLLAILIFPVVVMALFWFFGKDPESAAATLPVMPPR